MKLKLLSAIQEVDAAQWNRLVSNGYPFLQHAFIDSMEKNQCVGEDHGWIPRHLTCFDDQDNLLGALPLFEKHNSWGEFVFDYAWADAFHRAGLQYYPKLVNAIPFTPATGQRILLDAANRTAIKDALIKGTMSLVGQGEFSGLHSLFLNPDEYLLLKDDVTVTRVDCQFHWHNQNFSSFEDFLDTLKSKKRKNIRQERRKVKQSGVTIECLDGHSASETDWAEFTRLYRSIYNRKYGQPAFNAGFFKDVARSLAEQVLLVVARFDGRVIAASLMYHDAETLYGRHWGCDGYVDSLHFELCYYQGIEYCIRHNLKRFDPGAQGEHKIARGFLPTKTRSLHWMGSLQFRDAVK
ncbi:MAG: GNAT family N-acetyltransferase, partial [Pseudomonadota bacterium]